MISIPYVYLLFSLLVVCAFCKLGQVDEEIGWVLGLAAGLLVVIANHFWPGGYAGLALHAVGVFALLTVYKIIRGMTERRDPEE